MCVRRRSYTTSHTLRHSADAFVSHGAVWAQIVVSLGSLCALTTTVLTTYVAQSRIFFAMARDGLLPAPMGRTVGRRKVPLVAVVVVVLFGSFLGALVELATLAEMVRAWLVRPAPHRRRRAQVSMGTLIALSFTCASVRRPRAASGLA